MRSNECRDGGPSNRATQAAVRNHERCTIIERPPETSSGSSGRRNSSTRVSKLHTGGVDDGTTRRGGRRKRRRRGDESKVRMSEGGDGVKNRRSRR